MVLASGVPSTRARDLADSPGPSLAGHVNEGRARGCGGARRRSGARRRRARPAGGGIGGGRDRGTVYTALCNGGARGDRWVPEVRAWRRAAPGPQGGATRALERAENGVVARRAGPPSYAVVGREMLMIAGDRWEASE